MAHQLSLGEIGDKKKKKVLICCHVLLVERGSSYDRLWNSQGSILLYQIQEHA